MKAETSPYDYIKTEINGITLREVYLNGKKAGVDDEAKRCIERCTLTHQAGIREVVEYLGVYENELGFCEISNHASYAKLKEWGIK